MKISEKALLDNLSGITQDGTYISKVKNEQIYWNYRTGLTDDGYNAVTSRYKATEISLENDRSATIRMTSKWDNHASVAKIASLEAQLWGDEI